jgi:hypothetical protein
MVPASQFLLFGVSDDLCTDVVYTDVHRFEMIQTIGHSNHARHPCDCNLTSHHQQARTSREDVGFPSGDPDVDKAHLFLLSKQKMKLSVAIALVFLLQAEVSTGFLTSTPLLAHHYPSPQGRFFVESQGTGVMPTYRQNPRSLLLSMSDSAAKEELTPEETTLVQSLYERSDNDGEKLRKVLVEAMPSLSSKLVLKLTRLLQAPSKDKLSSVTQKVATVMKDLVDEQLAQGRETLLMLLGAGELRKLDAEIGRASRTGKLDMAFFTVLDMNLQAAAADELDTKQDDKQEASRFSILQHIYTRCQEEVEKLVPPEVALLNKLLRTEQDSIRANQLQHYLCPQPNVIKLPDGQEIPVRNSDQNKVLVPPSQLIDALASTVQKIRTAEKAGGIDREAAANMVESCRQVAREARIVIGQSYGVDSTELRRFEEGLQPVFRPSSPQSPYVQGGEA